MSSENERDNGPGDTDQDDQDLAGEWYADRFRVGQNAFEFKVDCGHQGEEDVRAVYLRVIANPSNARELFRQLGLGLLRYFDRFGRLDEADHQPGKDGT